MKIKQLPQGELYWRSKTSPRLRRHSLRLRRSDGTRKRCHTKDRRRWSPKLPASSGCSRSAPRRRDARRQPRRRNRTGTAGYGSRISAAREPWVRPPESRTPAHTHPGSEAFYVVAGRLGQRTPHGVRHIEAGQTMNGHQADVPMEVFNSGTADLTALIMFVWTRRSRFRYRPSCLENQAIAEA